MGLRLNVRPEHEVGVDMDEECMFDQDEAIREAFERNSFFLAITMYTLYFYQYFYLY
jgi:hypothetical protein